VITLSLCNLDPNRSIELKGEARGTEIREITGRVLTADAINAHNTFEEPERVVPTQFDEHRLEQGGLTVKLPPKSVVVLRMRAS